MLSAREQTHPVNPTIGEQKHYEKPVMILRKEGSCMRCNYPKDSRIHHIELMGEGSNSLGAIVSSTPRSVLVIALWCCRPEAAQWPEHRRMSYDTWFQGKIQPRNSSQRLVSSVLLAAQSPEFTTCPMSKSITHSQLVRAILEAHSYINNYVKEIIIHWLAASSSLSRLPSWK